MSGGYFRDCDPIGTIQYVIDNNKNSNLKNRNGLMEPIGSFYCDKVITKLKETVSALTIAKEMLHEVDLLFSNDNGEESYLRNLNSKNTPQPIHYSNNMRAEHLIGKNVLCAHQKEALGLYGILKGIDSSGDGKFLVCTDLHKTVSFYEWIVEHGND